MASQLLARDSEVKALMVKVLSFTLALPILLAAQTPNPTQLEPGRTEADRGTSPLYRVNVVGSETVAVNYANRQGAAKIQLEGTVLLPRTEGEAKIQSRKGATEIELNIEDLPNPARFGPEYLTYVAWALTPDGRATNLGQIVTDRKNNGQLKTATELQTFAVIVTAEPYYAVTQPSDVVVMKNVVIPGTGGNVETVRIKSELLSRGTYTYHAGAEARAEAGRKVSMDEYEALLELYQAQNAVNIARSKGAAEFAPDVFARAEQQLERARSYYAARNFKQVVPAARAASQTAEDARIVALRRQAERTEGGKEVAAKE
jgi:hypothetical protein